MPLSISCPRCAKRYQVAETLAGKQVRCQQCGTTFVASAAAAPLDPLAGVDLGGLPPAPAPGLGAAANPLGKPAGSGSEAYAPAQNYGLQSSVTNPSGGPTDFGMRLVCAGMLAGGLLLLIINLVMQATTGTLYLALVAFVPLFLMLGVAGLISPNVVRAMGKYGGHLSWHYKAIGYGILGLYFVVLVALMVGLFAAGFRPDRPGAPRGERPPTPPSADQLAIEFRVPVYHLLDGEMPQNSLSASFTEAPPAGLVI
jgi:predicted Zn finger-like uncharacterized protein